MANNKKLDLHKRANLWGSSDIVQNYETSPDTSSRHHDITLRHSPLRVCDIPLRPSATPSRYTFLRHDGSPFRLERTPLCTYDTLSGISINEPQERSRAGRRAMGGGDADRSRSVPPLSYSASYSSSIIPSYPRPVETPNNNGAIPIARRQRDPSSGTYTIYSGRGNWSSLWSNTATQNISDSNNSERSDRKSSKELCKLEEPEAKEPKMKRKRGCICTHCGKFIEVETPDVEMKDASTQTPYSDVALCSSNESLPMEGDYLLDAIDVVNRWTDHFYRNNMRHGASVRADLADLACYIGNMLDNSTPSNEK